jgi:hypothetical protein
VRCGEVGGGMRGARQCDQWWVIRRIYQTTNSL